MEHPNLQTLEQDGQREEAFFDTMSQIVKGVETDMSPLLIQLKLRYCLRDLVFLDHLQLRVLNLSVGEV